MAAQAGSLATTHLGAADTVTKENTMAGAPLGGQTATPNVNQAAAQGIYAAGLGTAAGMGYQPQQVGFGGYTPFVGVGGAVPTVSAGGPTERVGTAGTTPSVQAGQIGQTDLAQYINPYTQQVIDTSMADLERQRQMQQNQIGAQASQAGAFGGSRQGVAEALTNEAFARQGGQMAAGLRQAGFQQAQQMAGQDIASRMQAALANQGVAGQDLARQLQANLANQAVSGQDLARRLQAGLANQQAAGQDIQFGMQASLANQAARQADLQRRMQGQQFNVQSGLQGAQQRLGAAQQLAGISGQGFGMGQQLTQNLANQGMQQQALQQALIDAARGQYSGFMGAPAQSLGYMGSALGVTPTPQTTTATRQPGLFDYLTLGSYTAGSLGGSSAGGR